MQLCNSHLRNLKSHFSDALSSVRLALVATKSDVNSSSSSGNQVNLSELITNLYVATVEKVKGVLQDLLVFMQPDWSFNLKSNYKGSLCVEGIRENLLVGFLHHIGATMTAFTNLNSSAPPNLLLVLSKTCSNMEKSGVHMLLSMADDLYEIDSESSPILTHETELCAEMREAAQCLLDAYVQAQALNISQMLRKSVETRDWLNCLEPRSVRAVMKRVVEELGAIELVLNGLYDDQRNRTSASSDSSRKTHFSLAGVSRQYRSNWSNYTPSQLESSFVSNIHRLFSERVEIFGSVEFSKVSILTGIIKISLKVSECIGVFSNNC
jgi:vacuolar protein sorting-associated protein 51